MFCGYDPFDALNSRVLDSFPKIKKSVFGLMWIQFHKRSIFNFRALFLVPKGRNPKGIALFVLGLLEDYKRTHNKVYLNKAIELADWLLSVRSDLSNDGNSKWMYACWGYHFDWKARAFYVPKGKPNVITTVYVSKALYELGELIKIEHKDKGGRFTEVALDSANFIVHSLYSEKEGRSYFAYIPGEEAFVHNASLWAAAWVGFAASITSNDKYKQLALKVARQSTSEQGEDGSWVYGSRHHHHFVDGFHTGYNLEALDLLRKALDISEFDGNISQGLAYYKTQLFEQDGTAKYYNNNRYPLDMHCVSQAIFTLLKVGGSEADVAMAKKIIDKSIDTLYLPKQQRFVYQKHKYLTNRINYIRWTQSWVYYSFAYFSNYVQSQINNGEHIKSPLKTEAQNETD
jgi:hypothetical protein